MKKLFPIILLTLFYFNPVIADCYYAKTEAYSASKHAWQAFWTDNLYTCQRETEKAHRHASYARYAFYAESKTSNCSGCREAETDAHSAYIYAKNAYRADYLETCKSYAYKTYFSALDARAKTYNCN